MEIHGRASRKGLFVEKRKNENSRVFLAPCLKEGGPVQRDVLFLNGERADIWLVNGVRTGYFSLRFSGFSMLGDSQSGKED